MGVCVLAGTLIGLGLSSQTTLTLPVTELQASSSDSGDSFAIATGPVDENGEGVFMLDFLTGDLQCVVMNHRAQRFNALFRTNVAADLGIERSKKPQYLMVTGQMNFVRGTALGRPAQSVVYVIDANTGNFASYGFTWRRDAAATARPQGGAMVLLDKGTARTAAIRN